MKRDADSRWVRVSWEIQGDGLSSRCNRETGYTLRTTDYGYRQQKRVHELEQQGNTLGLELTGTTPAGVHGHSVYPRPHRAIHYRSYTREQTSPFVVLFVFQGDLTLVGNEMFGCSYGKCAQVLNVCT